MTTHLGLQRILVPSVQASALTTGSIALPSAVNAYTDLSSFDALATYTVPSGGVTNIVFAGIPQNYSNLQIRAFIRGAYTDTAGQSWIRLNNVTTDSYAWHGFYGTGAGIGTENSVNASKDAIYSAFRHPSANATAGLFGIGICDITDYSKNNKLKTVRTLSGYDANGSGQIRLYSGFLSSTTDAIRTITIQDQTGGGYAQYSQFTLYGIR